MSCLSEKESKSTTAPSAEVFDYCPQCRGVWLDRGELDKILDRAKEEDQPARGEAQAQSQQQPQQPYHQQPNQYPQQQGYYQKPYKRKKSLLEELFD